MILGGCSGTLGGDQPLRCVGPGGECPRAEGDPVGVTGGMGKRKRSGGQFISGPLDIVSLILVFKLPGQGRRDSEP